MQLIGLTGGIAAGKTVVADRLAELGAVRIDADRLAREVVEPGTPALAEIARRFGPGVIAADGSLDRLALGAVVFQDPDARRDLEAITHPAVRALSAARMAAAGEADADAVVVYDIPLLVESGRVDEFDRIVVVHAPREERIRRLVELRGMSPEEAERRIASQAADEDRLAVADVVIDSGVSLASTLAQTDRLWANLAGGVGGRS
ncbi:dephospho-CoA kinase [Clavibacter michiganensis]|uniref:dephospho-CoA kinase n=1 Tax=Clavibacter michiganensis TaxID=28447 RepID=UPI001AE8D70F|nr:dephospho-CoA kinase [Clavibacter michiganensis]MBP2458468.1 dephospho-CoA kinase [Clavibacter michiganensis]MDQ0411039.1 dephospho-CoA kinase [Clavibacter michiganensis]